MLPQGIDYAVHVLSAAVCATAVPLNPDITERELIQVISDLGLTTLFIHPSFSDLPSLSHLPLDVRIIPIRTVSMYYPLGETPLIAGFGTEKQREESVILIMRTSGSTGYPKYVPLTNRNICSTLTTITDVAGFSPVDRCLNVMPYYHIQGTIVNFFASLYSGGSVICASRFDSGLFYSWLYENNPTWTSVIPTFCEHILHYGEQNFDLPPAHNLRFINISGLHISPSTEQLLSQLFSVPVVVAYGMSEAGLVTINPFSPEMQRISSVGLPRGCEVMIVNSEFQDLPPFEIGEIVVRGPNVFSGYLNDDERSNSVFVDGWYKTRDNGYRDDDGFVYVVSRQSNIVNKGGELVSLDEIEQVFLSHPLVAAAIAFSHPHTTLGEDISIAVDLKNRYTVNETDLHDYITDKLSPVKWPRKIFVVEDISHLSNKQDLRNFFSRAFYSSDVHSRLVSSSESGEIPNERTVVSPDPKNPVEENMLRLWKETLDLEHPGVNDDFFLLGGNSLLATQVMMLINERFQVDLPISDLFTYPTVHLLSLKIIDSIGTRSDMCLVYRVKKGTEKPAKNMFFFPGHYSLPFDAHHLAQHIPKNYSVYSCNWPNSVTGAKAPLKVESLVAEIYRGILSIQPEGPYILGGFCLGGLISIEIARKLRERGDLIEALFLTDPALPYLGPGWLRQTRNPFLYHAYVLRDDGLEKWIDSLKRRYYNIIAYLKGNHWVRRRIVYGYIMDLAFSFYRQNPYPGEAILICSEEMSKSVDYRTKIVTVIPHITNHYMIKNSSSFSLLKYRSKEICRIIENHLTN